MKELSLMLFMFLIVGLMFATIVVVGWGIIEGNKGIITAVAGVVMVFLIFGRR